MTVHPRASLTKALELDLRKAIGEALQKHPDLTEVEIARALHHVLSSEAGAWLNFVLRTERHPNEPDKKADEA